MLGQSTKRMLQRATEVEWTDGLGYEHGESPPGGTANTSGVSRF